MRLFRIADREAAVPLGMGDLPVEVTRYGERTWGVYVGGELLCVTVYLKGARAVQALIGQLQDELRQARHIETAITLDGIEDVKTRGDHGGQDSQAYA